jgi:hypothetical protein
MEKMIIPTLKQRRLIEQARISLRILAKCEGEIALRAALALQALNLRNPLPDEILVDEDTEPIEF